MQKTNERKGTFNGKKGGNLKSPEPNSVFHVFSKLVELESGRKASEALESEGMKGVIQKLLPKIEFGRDQQKYFDLCFADNVTERDAAERMGIAQSRLGILKGEVFQALLKAHKSRGREERTKAKQGKEDHQDVWDSTHVHYVDFLKVEDSINTEALTEFERKVKEKIACVPSPYEELIRPELDEEEENRMKGIWKTLALLVAEARFTPLQHEVYELLYVKKVINRKAARRLGITVRKLIYQHKLILKKLTQARKRLEKKRVLRAQLNRMRGRKLTKKQREIWKLWSIDKLSERQIAERLGMPRSTCNYILRNLKKGGLQKSITEGEVGQNRLR